MTAEMTPEVQQKIRRWIIQSAVGVAGYAIILFLAAGRLDWVWGWAFIGLLALFMAAHPLLLIPRDPELLVERGKGSRAAGVKTWDKRITALSGATMITIWIVAGLDLRFGWSRPFSPAIHLSGLFFTALGYGLFLGAMVANPFFSEGVRIQSERGHTVTSGGPYRFLRHPGYAGVLLAHLAQPFLLGSPLALLPALVLAGLFVLRTALEDRTLRAELPGYEAYTRQTRYRLLPGVW
jgi:protein-S-isoprenylcysteine O-methyltransferase Ste14